MPQSLFKCRLITSIIICDQSSKAVTVKIQRLTKRIQIQCVCVCVCVCAHAHACACVCVRGVQLSRYLRLSRYLFNIEIKIIGFIIEILVIFCILLCTMLNI